MSLLQSGCGGSQAQRALAQAAVFTAIEVAGAAMQAAADQAAARDAQRRANVNRVRRRAGHWRLVRHTAGETGVPCEEEGGSCGVESECDDPDDACESAEAQASDKTQANPDTEAPTIGGCMVCE